jgi:predicted methyltransferase
VLTGLIQTAYAVTETDTLNAVLASRSDEDKVRDDARHPLETLTFFQIKPGMKIAEALPGGGWYTRILANYLGQDGTLYGVNYPDSLWPMLSYASPEWIA